MVQVFTVYADGDTALGQEDSVANDRESVLRDYY